MGYPRVIEDNYRHDRRAAVPSISPRSGALLWNKTSDSRKIRCAFELGSIRGASGGCSVVDQDIDPDRKKGIYDGSISIAIVGLAGGWDLRAVVQ